MKEELEAFLAAINEMIARTKDADSQDEGEQEALAEEIDELLERADELLERCSE